MNRSVENVSRFLIGICRRLIVTWLSVRLDLVVCGLENVPSVGPAILIANHPSAMDGLLLAGIVPRRLHGFSRAENFTGPLLGRILTSLGALAATNDVRDQESLGQNLRSLEEARRWIERGQVMVSTPEGDVNPAASLRPFKWGAIFLGSELGVPIVPVTIVGSENALANPRRPSILHALWPRRARVWIHFMAPLHFEAGTLDGARLGIRVEQIRELIQTDRDEIGRDGNLDRPEKSSITSPGR
jgi:1-acyl-sn-glycerol-3-phosphate acyltransferase